MADKNKGVAVRKTTEVATKADEKVLALLRDSFPVEQGNKDLTLPRLGMVSQDVTEEVKNPKTGKKEIKILTEAGTFFIERQGEEIDEKTGKKVWERTELGNEVEGLILFRRKQLRFYDSSDESFTSSPVYDLDDEILPLWKNKAEVAKGTPAELKARPEFQGTSAKGKPMSKLEENYILYVLYEGELYQLNLRGTSKFAFQSYVRSIGSPSVGITIMNSEAKENGAIAWNQMTFTTKRPINSKEAKFAAELVKGIKEGIDQRKMQFQGNVIESQRVENEFKKF